MSKNFFVLCLLFSSCFAALGQKQSKAADFKPKFAIKAGYNWSYITGSAEGFNTDSKSGFMVGASYSTFSTGMGYRSEIVFSRQGYTFENGGSNTDVLNDYIYLPQFTTFTIGTKVQFQLGAQIGFLLNAKKTTETKDSSLTSAMNKFDYGFAGGLEVYPVKALIIGARYNLGLGKLYKQDTSSPNPFPLPFNPETANFKNSILQFYVGFKF